MSKSTSGRRSGVVAASAALVLAGSLLSGCGAFSSDDGGGKVQLTWYINPDTGGQDAVAEACSTDDYTITTQQLPQDASQQRVQLVRRLMARDPGIDLMSIDPAYTAEFANAGVLEKPSQEVVDQAEEQQTLQGAVDAATYGGEMVVAPFWSNTQVLWYRKSFVEKAGLDTTEPLTWQQVIDAAAKNGGQLGVQANKYEGYAVWINALVAGAGGALIEDADKGADAKVAIDSPAGEKAAEVIENLASSKAAPSDLSVSNEGTAGTTFASDAGSFMVNWTYIFHNYDATAPDVAADIGYAPYPQTVAGQDAAPPLGGIGIGVSKYSEHPDEAMAAVTCMTNAKSQGINADLTGNMPASKAGYDYPGLKLQTRDADGEKVRDGCDPAKLGDGEVCAGYPEDLMKLFQDSLEKAAPRPVSPYWSDISGAILSTWHPPSGVNKETPKKSASFIDEVLKGETIL